MNSYKFLLIIIIFGMVIVILKKYYFMETFVQSNGKCIQYNIYANYVKESPDKFPSSKLLEWTFKSYNAPDIMYKYTLDIQKFVGINNTIWAIKKVNDKINWEYYFYGLSLDEPSELSNLYSYNPKLSLKEYYKNIHKKYFPLENLDIEKLNKYKNKLIIFSVDVHPKFFNEEKIGNIDIYIDKNNKNIIKIPYKCSCYSFSDVINHKGNNFIYDIKDNAQKLAMLDKLQIYPKNILIDGWENINHVTIIDKIYANSISINYFGFDIDTFIIFLKKHSYAKDFIDNIENNKEQLNHLSFEFAEDYDKYTLDVTKTTIYGSF